MWFTVIDGDTPDELARNYVNYIMKGSGQIERDSAILELFEHIKAHANAITETTYELVVRIKYDRMNYYIAAHGPERAIGVILKCIRDQAILSNIVNNPNATAEHLDAVEGLLDDSPIAQRIRSLITVRRKYL